MKKINKDDLKNEYLTGHFLYIDLQVDGYSIDAIIEQLQKIKGQRGDGIIFSRGDHFNLYQPYSLEDLIKNYEGSKNKEISYIKRKIKLLEQILKDKDLKIEKYKKRIEKTEYDSQMKKKLKKMEQRRWLYYSVIRDSRMLVDNFSDNYSVSGLREAWVKKIKKLREQSKEGINV